MKLKNYLHTPFRKITQRSFAKALGISTVNLGRLVSGLALPTLKTALKIEELTGGEVTVYDWIDPIILKTQTQEIKKNVKKT